jgi:hypothetical protein
MVIPGKRSVVTIQHAPKTEKNMLTGYGVNFKQPPGGKMRIIRSIRVDRDIWERAKVAIRQNNQYISHYIEEKLREYIGKKDTPGENKIHESRG